MFILKGWILMKHFSFRLFVVMSYQHGDRKGPPRPTQPPSPLLYTSFAAPTSYSSGEGSAMGMGGPLRSPCWITNRSPRYTRKSLREKPRASSRARISHFELPIRYI